MYPRHLCIGFCCFGLYTVFILLGFVTGYMLLRHNLKRTAFFESLFPTILIYIYLPSQVVSHAYWHLEYEPPLTLHAMTDFIFEGHVFLGGLFGGVLGLYLYCLRHKLPVFPMLNHVCPSLASGYAITRVGCFFNGCCYGSITSCPISIRYPAAAEGPYMHHLRLGLISLLDKHSLAVHPTPLYAAIGSLMICLVLLRNKNNSIFNVSIYFILYGSLRFFLEFIRGEPVVFRYASLSGAQLLSLGLIIAGVLGGGCIYKFKGRYSGA